jgi:allantoinase
MTPNPEQILRSRRVLTPEGLRPAELHLRDGRIASVRPLEPEASAGLLASPAAPAPEDAGAGAHPPLLDLGDRCLIPGVVDTHVHVNEPGRTEWEGFETATRAAAAGGITALIDMPLNSIPVTTTLEALRTKAASAEGHCWIDVGFWGGVVPGNAHELEPMIDAGVTGFKAFLIHSGIDDFPAAGEADLRQAMPILARRGIPLLVHAELCRAGDPDDGRPSARYADYLASRPRAWENDAVRLMIDLCRDTGCPVHIVHLSSADALEDLAAARREGLPITVETCPHYLYFAAEDVPAGSTQYKCAPPIREAENRERLWQGLRDGTIDFVVCDHSPCTPALKRFDTGDFMAAWGGIASLQFSLSVVWTQARARGFQLEQVLAWMAGRTARFAGLEGRKGAIAPGHDADLVAWDPEAEFVLEPGRIHHRHKVTPYLDHVLRGVIETTWLRGHRVYDRGAFSPAPLGRALWRNTSGR